jgi:hypothetical protein
LPQDTKIIHGIFFKKVDHIDCKIIPFEVKKDVLFTPCKARSANFEPSWLQIFLLYKIEALDIMLGNWAENPLRKTKKSSSSFFKGSLNKKMYVLKERTKLLITLI